MLAVYAVCISVGLALVWGAGSWLKWQQMKNGTIIPRGSLTGRYGSTGSFCLKLTSVVVLVSLAFAWVWWAFMLLAPVWFLGNWAATFLERALYCDDSRLETFVTAAEEYADDFGP